VSSLGVTATGFRSVVVLLLSVVMLVPPGLLC
jgi:hypothetical protein